MTTCLGNCCSPGCRLWCLWWCLFVLSFFPRGVLDEILNSIESVSEDFPSYSFSFVRAVVACAILERTSGLEPSSETTAPRYLKLVTVPNFCPFTFISLWMPLALFVISLVFSVLISILYHVQVLSRLSTRALAPALPQLEHLCHRQTADW